MIIPGVVASGQAVAGGSDWILSGGIWNDAGVWDDAAMWED
jgi:hypothetical protein